MKYYYYYYYYYYDDYVYDADRNAYHFDYYDYHDYYEYCDYYDYYDYTTTIATTTTSTTSARFLLRRPLLLRLLRLTLPLPLPMPPPRLESPSAPFIELANAFDVRQIYPTACSSSLLEPTNLCSIAGLLGFKSSTTQVKHAPGPGGRC